MCNIISNYLWSVYFRPDFAVSFGDKDDCMQHNQEFMQMKEKED